MLKPIEFISQKDCTGCESCKAVCGLNCISMVQDGHGFYYPMIETDRCVNCGACERACPVSNFEKAEESISKIYACRAKDTEIVRKSSSGGLFSVLANYVLESGGYVCGAAWNNEFKVIHKVVSNESDLTELRGSKYVQSHVSDALSLIRKLNKKNVPDLFVGTPCQVAGARRVMGDRPSHDTVFVEVVCHGVPSPGVFEKYIHELEAKFRSEMISLDFRNKSAGWKSYRFKATFKNGTILEQDGHENPYVKGFISNLYLRDCCTSCRFKNFRSGADITIGDFWGVETLRKKEFADDRGVSLICTNTPRGAGLFSAVKGRLEDVVETDLETASLKNSCLVKPTEYNPRTRRFYRYLKNHTVSDAVAMADKTTFMDKVRISLAYRLGKLFNAES